MQVPIEEKFSQLPIYIAKVQKLYLHLRTCYNAVDNQSAFGITCSSVREESWLAAAQESTLGEKWLMIALKWKLWNNSTFVQVQFEKFSTVIYTLSKLHLVLIIKLTDCIYHFSLT